MKKLFVTLFIIFFFSSNNFSQIDTSDYFPLKTGNYWEYWGLDNWSTDWIRMTLESIGDTSMPNGIKYQTIRQIFYVDSLNPSVDKFFLRTAEKKVYYYYPEASCFSSEFLLYDFEKADSSIWPICSAYSSNHRGIEGTFLFYSPTLNLEYEGKLFNWLDVNGTDTIWAPMGSPYVDKIGKGIGIVDRFMWDFSDFYIYGARINNQIYGTLTSIEKEDVSVKNFSLSQNYPNPFNPSTSIQYAISSKQFVVLKVYDVLSKEVATLVNEDKSAGSYDVKFNASHLASGIYYYQLRAGQFVETKKMILLK